MHLLFGKAGCFTLSVTSFYSTFVVFFFNIFLPIFSAFCQHYSAASWVMINTITSLIFGCIKIHVVCSRENCFVNPIFPLGRSIHDVRLGELLDRNVGTEIIWEFQGCLGQGYKWISSITKFFLIRPRKMIRKRSQNTKSQTNPK